MSSVPRFPGEAHVRLILLVLLFLIWEMWTPDAGRLQVLASAVGVWVFVSGYCLLIFAMRGWANRIARGRMRGETGIDRFNLGMNIARFLIPIWFAAGVFTLGWHEIVDQLLRPIERFPLLTPSAAVGLIPGLFGWMGLWWSQYPVDCALREYNALQMFEAEMPVFAPSDFRGYFLNKLRVQLLFTSVPVLLILLLRDLLMLGAMYAAHTQMGQSLGLRLPFSDTDESVISFGPAVLVMIFSPAILRHILHTQRLPESRLRRSLALMAEKTGVRCREILLWKTQNNMGNAAVMGLIPRVRFVMLSDLLLESMTDLQIQAVFAHELGHVKHRHLAWFVAFLLTASSCLFAITGAIGEHLTLSENWKQAYDVLSVLGCAAVLITAFGFISRWFERQADVFAARAIQRWADLAVEIPDLPLPVPANLGSDVFASALHRVAVVNNIPIEARNWTHGSIDSRIRYIRRFGRETDVAASFDRSSRRIFVLLLAVIGMCGAVAGISAVVMK
jgi:Zn-dependent protease with chaperone function